MIFLFCIHLMNLYIFEAFYLQDLDPHLSVRIRFPEAFLNVDPCGSGWFFTILKKKLFSIHSGPNRDQQSTLSQLYTIFSGVKDLFSARYKPHHEQQLDNRLTPLSCLCCHAQHGPVFLVADFCNCLFPWPANWPLWPPLSMWPPPTHHQQGPRVWCQWHAVMQCEEIHPPHPPTADWAKLALNQFYLNICRYCNWNLLVAVIVPGIVL